MKKILFILSLILIISLLLTGCKDVCDNGSCEATESYRTCPSDCCNSVNPSATIQSTGTGFGGESFYLSIKGGTDFVLIWLQDGTVDKIEISSRLPYYESKILYAEAVSEICNKRRTIYP